MDKEYFYSMQPFGVSMGTVKTETEWLLCEHCESVFDDNNDGHYDDATGIAFCCQECECMYDKIIGLPGKYQRQPN